MSHKGNLSRQHIDQYLADFRALGFEQCSVERYQYVLLSLLKFREGKHKNHECTREDLINFKIQLVSDFKPVTVNFYLAVIREFFKYLDRMGISIDIAKGIRNVRLERTLPSFVGSEELDKLFELTDNSPSLFVFESRGSAMINARDLAIFETVIGTGIKAKQLCEIKRSEVDLTKGYLIVRSGGREYSRTIPIPRQTLNAIKKYAEYREIIFQKFPYFFIYRSGAKFHPRCVNRVCSKFLRQTGSKNKGPQTLRNTFVNVLAEGGANIQSIRYLAGYHSIQRTNEKCSVLSTAVGQMAASGRKHAQQVSVKKLES